MTITNTYGKIASVRPANTDEVQLYTIPSSTEIIAILNICNQGTSDYTYRVAHTTAGHGDTAADGDDWLIYDRFIGVGESHQISIYAKATETIRVKASEGNVISFVLSGQSKVVS